MNTPKNSKIGFTSAHTILKNELKFIDKWMEYTKDLDYRVLLDTGSTDGSWEYLQELAKKDRGLIIKQQIWSPEEWRFDVARKVNLEMVPKETVWCFSPDMDEYFSRNTLKQLENYVIAYPQMTNMSCCRLDVYSEEVFVGQQKGHLGSNKIFKFGDYRWKSRIYEHLSWIHKDKQECEIYNPEVYLIHDQDYKKKERSPLYFKMLTQVYNELLKGKIEEDSDWCMWFLVNHYFKEQNLEMTIKTGCEYIKIAKEPEKKAQVVGFLENVLKSGREVDGVSDNLKKYIIQSLKQSKD